MTAAVEKTPVLPTKSALQGFIEAQATVHTSVPKPTALSVQSEAGLSGQAGKGATIRREKTGLPSSLSWLTS